MIPLDPANPPDPAVVLTARLPALLPGSEEKKLDSPQHVLAAFVHTAMAELNFCLVAIDERSAAISDPNNVLPEGWDQHGPDNYTFRYEHDERSSEFLLKVLKLGPRTLFHAIALEDGSETATLDIYTDDFISPSPFPHVIGTSPLVGFISSSRIVDFISQFQSKIISRIFPGSSEGGYVEELKVTSTNERADGALSSLDNQSGASPRVGNLPHVPGCPGLFNSTSSANPLAVGDRDLDQLPTPRFSHPNNGGGMLMERDHPIFTGSGGSQGDGLRGPWGGDGFLPPMGAPAHARFDPVGPSPNPSRGGSHDPFK